MDAHLPHRTRPDLALAMSLASALALVRSAHADAEAARACEVAVEQREPSPSPEWAGAVEALRREVAAAPRSVCHGVRLVVQIEADGVRLVAHAPDGSTASRLVRRPLGLSPIAFGLLAAAPVARVDESVPETPQASAPPPRPEADVEAHADDSLSPTEAASHFLALSASTGARAAFPTNVVMAEFGVRVDLDLHGWVVDFGMRAAPFSIPARAGDDGDAYDETALSLGVGRAIRQGRSAWVLTGGPNLAYIWMENDALNVTNERAQLRLAAVVRWAYDVSPVLRLNVTLDGEFAPTGALHGRGGDGLAPFPVGTFGIQFGTEALL